MALVKIPDEAGKTIAFIELNGRLLPQFDIDCLENVPSLPLRDDDVLVCAFPKCGTHWLFEISRMLKQNTTNVPVQPKDDFMIEFIPQKTLASLPSPRILNSHYRFQYLPSDLKKKKTKIIYIRRNPKDAAVSFYNHSKKLSKYYEYDGEFKDYLKLFVDGKVDYGSWFEYVKEWEQIISTSDLPILELTYEGMKEDPVGGIRKISEFLGTTPTEELIRDIHDKCSFSSMSQRKGHFTGMVEGQSIMYRKGEVGDWKNWFTVALNEWFDQIYAQKMSDSKLQFKYSL
ncbi:sulfotransferase 1C2 [Patella vulgata]|uniref:sulfotransferase 1C2 n=1 Tax=Patella vulgata TaxID=6465 RepID=UPI00217F6F03|nr:sulfotransferase 1C2 [Patella vulgata]